MLSRWLLTLCGCASASLHGIAAERVEFGDALYHVHHLERAHLGELQLRWLGAEGKPLSNFQALQRALHSEGRELAFATNAGIYRAGPTPCGLTVCEGKELVALNLQDGEGNFFMKPNGVFFVTHNGQAGILEASAFARSGIAPRIASQSGPLLLRNGTVHPSFNVNSPNKRQRSAVGVRASDGRVLFAVTDRADGVKGRVTFHQLATFFLHLGCKDALYLDGDISEMLVHPPRDAVFPPNTFAAMFVVAK